MPDTADLDVLITLAMAAVVGLILGFERGWHEEAAPDAELEKRTAGIRTFTFAGLLGGLTAVLAGSFGPWLIVAGFLGLGGLAFAGYVMSALQTQQRGFTTEVALLVTFSLGVVVGIGLRAEAVAAAVVSALILGMKEEIHAVVRGLDRRELLSTLQLLVVAVVAVPLLPDHGVGPYDAINPRTVGLMALLISAISFVGYFAVRWLGTGLGLLLTAALGGLASSTAVTVSFARMAASSRGAAPVLGAGVALACAVMAPRLLVLVSIINVGLLPRIVVPLAALGLVPAAASIVLVRRAQRRAHATPDVQLSNPLQLGPALIFAAALAILFVLVPAMREWLGDVGVIALAALSGLTDVDAIGISLAQGAGTSVVADLAARAIVIAAISNTMIKGAISVVLSDGVLVRSSGVVLAVASLSSLALALLL
jgi:uncharacterized membrane protein (DUF4010 family)